jgi:translocation and assembly module TamB
VARQFLYGQAATALTKRVGSLFGFDRFRIDPIAEAGQPISGVGVTVGKRLSRDVFVTYSSDPSTNRQYVVQVEWQVKRNVTLVLTQAGDGTYAVDAQWQRRF